MGAPPIQVVVVLDTIEVGEDAVLSPPSVEEDSGMSVAVRVSFVGSVRVDTN